MAQSILIDRDEIFKKVRKMTEDCNLGKCLYATLSAYFLLGPLFPDILIQAGSMSWPIVEPEQDDGVSPTHFTYLWSPTDFQSYRAVLQDKMPEMHVWLVMIDMTTYELPMQNARITGSKWQAKPPPEYLWAEFDELPKMNVVYEANAEATFLAYQYMRNVLLRGEFKPMRLKLEE